MFPACSPGSVPTSLAAKHPASTGPGCRRAHTDLVLAAPAGVVQVVITPVVMGPVLCLLIQPVELVGAALHVILQRVQILLPLLGASLGRVRGESSAQSSSPRVLLGVPGQPGKGPLQKGSAPRIPEVSHQQLLVFGLEVACVFLVTEEKQGKS